MELNSSSILVTSQNQVSASLSDRGTGDVVILGLQDGMYFELNEVGARIWELIQTPHSIQAIVAVILDEYDVPRDQCEADIVALANDLIARGLVEVKDGHVT